MNNSIISFDRRSMTASSFSKCPHCGSNSIKKNGKEHNHQRWYCNECHKSFSSRSETILYSSKLSSSQLRNMISLLKDNVLIHQVSHQIKVSIQTVILWKRKLQHLIEKQDNIVLSNNVYVDETYIKIPMKERSKIKKRGLSKELEQIAVAIDNKGHALAILNGRGKASNSDSERVFAGHIDKNATIYHDKGHFGNSFLGREEYGIDSSSFQAKRILNPINRLCNQIQRIFKVHLRVHHKNIQKYLDEYIERINMYDDKKYYCYLSKVYENIFFCGKTFRRRDIRTT